MAAGFTVSRELVDAVFEFPYCRISNLTESGPAKRRTVPDAVADARLERHRTLFRMNEADTRAKHIDPALKAAGRVVLDGSGIRRAPAKAG